MTAKKIKPVMAWAITQNGKICPYGVRTSRGAATELASPPYPVIRVRIVPVPPKRKVKR